MQPQSAFSVRLGEYNPSSDKIIRFRHIVYNEQNHYSPQTGLFTCVIPGLYQFSFLCSAFVDVGSAELLHNNELVQHSFKVSEGGRYLSSGDAVLRLQTGDKVWLEATDGITGLTTTSFFSGHLLFAV
ncbi:protein HP-25 homolog 1-like [Embiotoca jacksoni]|uniref:protein HP-25 homolog 1-like n=1 Tax=Embiotoca jacksoni TaxID=100190 RepID=UPI0037037512